MVKVVVIAGGRRNAFSRGRCKVAGRFTFMDGRGRRQDSRLGRRLSATPYKEEGGPARQRTTRRRGTVACAGEIPAAPGFT